MSVLYAHMSVKFSVYVHKKCTDASIFFLVCFVYFVCLYCTHFDYNYIYNFFLNIFEILRSDRYNWSSFLCMQPSCILYQEEELRRVAANPGRPNTMFMHLRIYFYSLNVFVRTLHVCCSRFERRLSETQVRTLKRLEVLTTNKEMDCSVDEVHISLMN